MQKRESGIEMINFYEFSKQSRCDISLSGVYSFMVQHPYMKIQKVVNEQKEKNFVVRVHYIDPRRDKVIIHTFNFYRSTEAQEAHDFINKVADTFHATISGDLIF